MLFPVAPYSASLMTAPAPDYSRFRCLRCLTGHEKSVYALALSLTGEHLYSWSLDGALKIWDLASGHCLRTLTGLHQIKGLWISAREEYLVTYSWDEPIQCRHLPARQSLNEGYSFGSRQPVSSLAINSTETCLASADWNHHIHLWQFPTGDYLGPLVGHQGDINSLTFTSDNRYLISGSWDGTIRCWDLDLGACVQVLTSHSQQFDKAVITQDASRIVALGKNKAISIWDVRQGKCRKTVRGHSKSIADLLVSPDNHVIITASWDESIRFWELETGHCFHQQREHQGRIWCAALSRDGRYLVTGGQDRQIRLWGNYLPTEDRQNEAALDHSIIPESMQ
ncbi:WD40 repeat domain-containing protein [Synechocystis sp. LKSZ1]|uniref:WD40 repeat domain-containing protein n=1 Tax=Synechocystis sp. LKSZ1 TaxID=3144951 RepID=UPI00336BCCCD